MKINTILAVEDDAFNGLSKVAVLADEHHNNAVYLFCKPENKPQVGDVKNGTVGPDRAGNLKFTPEKTGQWAAPGVVSQVSPVVSPDRTFKVDPDKTHSIERQTTLIQATALVVAVINNSDKPITTKDATTAVEGVFDALWSHIYDPKPVEEVKKAEGTTDEALKDLESIGILFDKPADATQIARNLAESKTDDSQA